MDNYIKSNGEGRISWQFMEDNNFFALFLWKNLVVSKKSSTFALAFEERRTLPNGVMVALQILVLSVWVRVLVWQHILKIKELR